MSTTTTDQECTMSEYHAVIMPDEIGIDPALPIQDDEFVCPGCHLVCHDIRRQATGTCDECLEDGVRA